MYKKRNYYCVKYTQTAHNKAVTASPPIAAARGSVLLGRLKAPTQHSTHIFAVAGIASQFLNRNRKNVSYRQTLNAIFAGICLD